MKVSGRLVFLLSTVIVLVSVLVGMLVLTVTLRTPTYASPFVDLPPTNLNLLSVEKFFQNITRDTEDRSQSSFITESVETL